MYLVLATSYGHLQAFQEIEKKVNLVEETEGLKKNLEQEKQMHSETKAVAKALKSKLDAETNTANTLRMTIS